MDAVEQKIIDAYEVHLLEEGKDPSTVFKFCRKIDIPEKAFYNHFPNFESIRCLYWAKLGQSVFDEISSDEVYCGYDSREQWLAFLFAYFEKLTEKRSFVMAIYPKHHQLKSCSMFRKLREVYEPWVEKWLSMIDHQEKNILPPQEVQLETAWLMFLFLHHFWSKDDSKGFERTDAAIEKSVNLYYQLLEPDLLNTAIDFAKFMMPNFQSPMDLIASIKGKFK